MKIWIAQNTENNITFTKGELMIRIISKKIDKTLDRKSINIYKEFIYLNK